MPVPRRPRQLNSAPSYDRRRRGPGSWLAAQPTKLGALADFVPRRIYTLLPTRTRKQEGCLSPILDQIRQVVARFRLAAFAPSLPSAVRVFFGRCAIVRFFLAAREAFLMFFRASVFCFVLAIDGLLPNDFFAF